MKRLFVIWLVLCGVVSGVEVPPSAPEHTLIVAHCRPDAQVAIAPASDQLTFAGRLKVGPAISAVEYGSDIVWTAPPGTYRVAEMLTTDGTTVIDQAICAIGGAPPVPPTPDPTPDPTPKPPTPEPEVQRIRVLFLYEANDVGFPGYPSDPLTSVAIRQYCTEHCIQEPGDMAAFRVWDNDYKTSDLGQESAAWRDLYSQAKSLAGQDKHPWLAIQGENGQVLYNGMMPNTIDGVMSLLRKYGGD